MRKYFSEDEMKIVGEYPSAAGFFWKTAAKLSQV